MVKDWNKLRKTYYKKASYLSTDINDDGRFDFNEHQFQLSRNAKALKIWMSFKAYGSDRIKQMIEKDISLTKYLTDQLEIAEDFEVITKPDLSVVCFKYLGKNGQFAHDPQKINEINKRIITALEKDGRVFITGTTLDGQSVIRACLINHRLQQRNVDFLIQTMREVGSKLE